MKTDTEKLQLLLQKFDKAFFKFQQLLPEQETDIIRDSAILRFQFTFELFWKVLKEYCAYNSIIINSPRESIREAFRLGIIPDDVKYLEMLDNRNLIVHTYGEETAEEIYHSLKTFSQLMNNAIVNIKSKIL